MAHNARHQTTLMSFSTFVTPGAPQAVQPATILCGRADGAREPDLTALRADCDLVAIEVPGPMRGVLDGVRDVGGVDARLDRHMIGDRDHAEQPTKILGSGVLLIVPVHLPRLRSARTVDPCVMAITVDIATMEPIL